MKRLHLDSPKETPTSAASSMTSKTYQKHVMIKKTFFNHVKNVCRFSSRATNTRNRSNLTIVTDHEDVKVQTTATTPSTGCAATPASSMNSGHYYELFKQPEAPTPKSFKAQKQEQQRLIECAVPGCQTCLKEVFTALGSRGLPMEQANLARIAELTSAVNDPKAVPCESHMRFAMDEVLNTLKTFEEDQSSWFLVEGNGISFKPLTDIIRKFPECVDVQTSAWELLMTVDFADLLCHNERVALTKPPEVPQLILSIMRELRALPYVQVAAWRALTEKFRGLVYGVPDLSTAFFEGEGLLVSGVLQVSRMVVEEHTNKANEHAINRAVLDSIFEFMQVFLARTERISARMVPSLKGMVSHRRWWTRRFVGWLQSPDPNQVTNGTKVLCNGPVIPWLDPRMNTVMEYMTRELTELRDALCPVFVSWSGEFESRPNTPSHAGFAINHPMNAPNGPDGYVGGDLRADMEAPIPDLLRVFRSMTVCPQVRKLLTEHSQFVEPIRWSIYRFHEGYIRWQKSMELQQGGDAKAIKHILVAHLHAFSYCMELGYEEESALLVLHYLSTAQARLGVWINQFRNFREVGTIII